MTISEYQKKGISIETLPLNILRGIDIANPIEEKMIQELVNQKLQTQPVKVEINKAGDKTDFKTPAEEAEFQRIIDERIASARPQVDPTPVGDPPEPTPPLQVNRFCEFCTAKGPISHLKACTRPEKSLKDKINALKAEKAKLE